MRVTNKALGKLVTIYLSESLRKLASERNSILRKCLIMVNNINTKYNGV